MDTKDRKILNLLQKDASLTNQQIAERVGGSATAVWRRIQTLEASGVMRRRVVLVDRRAAGLKVCMICHVKLVHHTAQTRREFESFVLARDEVTECYSISGSYDYMLIVVVPDVETYEHFLTRILLDNSVVDAANSSLTLREVKYSTAVRV